MGERQRDETAVQIREAVPVDARAIVSLLYESFLEYRSLYTPAGFAATAIGESEVLDRLREGPMLVATANGGIVGTVAMVAKGDALYLRGMAVHPSARGQRVGDRLLNEVEKFARSHGAQRLFLSTTPFLARAIRLYQRFGFRRVAGKPDDLFGTPLFTMEKYLDKGSGRVTDLSL